MDYPKLTVSNKIRRNNPLVNVYKWLKQALVHDAIRIKICCAGPIGFSKNTRTTTIDHILSTES